MALFRGSQKLHRFLQSTSANPQSFSFFRHFSTGNEQQQTQDPSAKFDPFLTPPGLVYARLSGINESTLKTDIINLFEGCLTLDDIKVEYGKFFNPLAMVLQFPSDAEFNTAFRANSRKARFLKLDKVDRKHWDDVPSNNGHYVVLSGIPRNAQWDDIERFMCGCNYISSSLDVFMRYAGAYPIRMAKIGFPTHIEAMNAMIQKNGSFCLNNRIDIRLIQ